MNAPAPKPPPRITVTGLGLIVVGSEILNARRTDKHFAYCLERFRAAGYALEYALVLPDEPALLEAQLRWAMSGPVPFVCCGGIGATPDDYTRAAAAQAAGVALAIHPDGQAILERRWGPALTPTRARLVEFPAGATLIPNPVNQVPGFTMANGHFVPGFPEMAQPMIAWVLDTYYTPAASRRRHSLILPGAREGDLIPLMEALVAAFPDCAFSSLPRFVPGGGTEVELSLCGPAERADAGLAWMVAALEQAGVAHRPLG